MPDIEQAKILATHGFEEAELTAPQSTLSLTGANVTVAAPQSRQSKGTIRGWDKTDWGKAVAVRT
ncbi:putative intracellular protease/amidase [Methylobacterium sp. PvR107]|nr:putative intracellular protease/amidase [Methylobacterium sp. PvR107]